MTVLVLRFITEVCKEGDEARILFENIQTLLSGNIRTLSVVCRRFIRVAWSFTANFLTSAETISKTQKNSA